MKRYTGIAKLVSLLILLPIVMWKITLKETVGLYEENIRLTAHQTSTPVHNVAPRDKVLETKSLLGNGTILQLFADSMAREEIQTINYTPEIINSENGYNLYCGKWMLSSNYINLVTFISQLEKAKLPLRIASADFELANDLNINKKKLILTLLLVNIEK